LSHETAAGLKYRITGTYDLPHKTLGVIFNFDKMIAGEFEKMPGCSQSLGRSSISNEAPVSGALPQYLRNGCS